MPEPTRRSKTTPQQQADEWNAANPTGVIVDVQRDNGDVLRTVTRSHAWALGADEVRGKLGHTAVIMVKGISGCYALDRVTRVPFNEADEATLEFERAGGSCACLVCGQEYRAHPDDLDHPSYNGLPGLVKLCDGRLVKL